MDGETLEQKIDRLAQELADLRCKVDSLAAVVPRKESPSPTQAYPQADAGEEIVEWMGRSSFLPRVSAVCFLLVFALLLRTVTDNGLVGLQVGSLLGMVYATLLIFLGWYLYGRTNPLAPVFAVCGAVLMYTVVSETHARFESLPSVPAYLILVVTGIVMATISYRHLNALPVLIGSLGMGIAAIGIDYPNPHYPHLAVVLLVANLLGAFATRLRRCSWLRWILLILTVSTLFVWGVKLGIRLGRDEEAAVAFGLHWYRPVIVLFAAVFSATALLAFFRRSAGDIARFDLALPAVNALWAVPAALLLARVEPGAALGVGVAGLAAGAFHLGGASVLQRLRGSEAKGTTSLVLAAALWMVVSIAPATGTPAVAFPALSLAALALARLSGKWNRGGIRALSYLLQVAVAVALTVGVLDGSPAQTLLLQAVGGGSLGGIALAHYLWCRRTPPPDDSPFFGKWDKEDHTAVLLLLAALVGTFILIRPAIWLLSQGGAAPEFVFQAGESVAVNLGAAGLFLASWRRRNRELRNLGILIVMVGAGKVFLGDLPRISGVPLVGSVLSFGVAVSLVSFVLARWTRGRVRGEESSDCGKYA